MADVGKRLEESINELLALHSFGRFAEMEQRARVVLKSFAGTPVLRELLGVALASQRRYAEALPNFERAARDHPNDPQFWNNLALCQCELKQYAPAEQSLRRSLALNPASIETLVGLGRVLHLLQQDEEAGGVLEAALAAAPGHPAAHYNLGEVLAARGRLVEAEQHLRLAIAASPGIAATHNALGNLLLRRGLPSQAEASFRHAIGLDPSSPITYANLALALSAQDRSGEAADAARTALAALGGAVPEISADNIDLVDQIANVLDSAGATGESLRLYKATVKFSNEPRRAIWAIYAARRACDWDFAALLEPQACRIGESASGDVDESAPWRLLSIRGASASQQLAAARRSAQRVVGSIAPAASARAYRPRGQERLRIGYFSGDFYNHPVSHLMVGVIEQHDRARFQIIGYDFSPPADDDYRRRFEQAFDKLSAITAMSHEEAAQYMAGDEVDIVIDLAGWTKRARPAVLAMRPAPVQVQWLGYPGTLGAPWIDYIVADAVIIRPQDEPYYAEKIIRLPHTYQANDDKRAVVPAQPRGAHGLPDDAVVLCSFNRPFKFTPEVFDCWLNLLQAIERSVLWLLEAEEMPARALTARAMSRGIDPARIVFAPMASPPEHLARLALADLALDNFPYGSHTTASDALWVGVPLIALTGDTFAARVSASILSAAGLPELITSSLDDYYGLAFRLASNRDELTRLKARVAALRAGSPLFDTARFTRELESALAAIWQRHCGGQPPAHVSIDQTGTAHWGDVAP